MRHTPLGTLQVPGSPEHVAVNPAALTIPLNDAVLTRLDPLAREVSGERHGPLRAVRSRAQL